MTKVIFETDSGKIEFDLFSAISGKKEIEKLRGRGCGLYRILWSAKPNPRRTEQWASPPYIFWLLIDVPQTRFCCRMIWFRKLSRFACTCTRRPAEIAAHVHTVSCRLSILYHVELARGRFFLDSQQRPLGNERDFHVRRIRCRWTPLDSFS